MSAGGIGQDTRASSPHGLGHFCSRAGHTEDVNFSLSVAKAGEVTGLSTGSGSTATSSQRTRLHSIVFISVIGVPISPPSGTGGAARLLG